MNDSGWFKLKYILEHKYCLKDFLKSGFQPVCHKGVAYLISGTFQSSPKDQFIKYALKIYKAPPYKMILKKWLCKSNQFGTTGLLQIKNSVPDNTNYIIINKESM